MSIPKATPTAEHTDFLNMKDSAEALGCGERWLRDGINHHGFPHHRLGKSLQTSAQDRAQIRAMHRVPAQPSKRAAARKSHKAAAQKSNTPAKPSPSALANVA